MVAGARQRHHRCCDPADLRDAPPPEFRLQEKMKREAQRVERAIALAEKDLRGRIFPRRQPFQPRRSRDGCGAAVCRFPLSARLALGDPKLAAWHAGIVSRPSFEETLPPDLLRRFLHQRAVKRRTGGFRASSAGACCPTPSLPLRQPLRGAGCRRPPAIRRCRRSLPY